MRRHLTPCRLPAAVLAIALPTSARGQCDLVIDLTPGTAAIANSSWHTDFFGQGLFFRASTAAAGAELWRWDPDTGASLVLDFAPGSTSHNPEQLTPGTTAFGPRLFYSGSEVGHGWEPFVSDGTPGGTFRLREIRSGSASSLPQKFCACGDRMFFQANDGTIGDELWITDGTTAGTQLVLDIRPGSGNGRPDDPCALDDVLLFAADDGVHGKELWRSDGTAAGTWLVADLRPGANAASPGGLTRVGDIVFFAATSDTAGRELWRTDGTAAGTWQVVDLTPGATHSSPSKLTACGERLFFTVGNNPIVSGLCVSDGTAVGTVPLGPVAPDELTCSGNRLFCRSGGVLWVSDGTVAGTHAVANTLTAGANHLTACATGVFYATNDVPGGDLWFSDGTAGGTVPVCLMDPTQSYVPHDLVVSGGQLLFTAYTPTWGQERFRVQTPGASVTRLGNGGRADHTTLGTRDGAPPVLGTAIDLVGRGPANQYAALLAAPILPPSPVPIVPGFVLGGTDWVGILAGTAIFAQAYDTPDTAWTFAIPNDPTWEGLLFRFQMLWWDPVGPVPYQLSNGLQLALGTAAPH